MTPQAAHVNPIRGARQAVILGYSIDRLVRRDATQWW
jgi:hypothetical protein